jgi:GT2 family glycosyltransferase
MTASPMSPKTTAGNRTAAVVFVNYNTSDQIIEALRSLAGEPVCKVIVVDNASPSDNPETIEAAFPEIELIKLSSNVGFGEGCNAGARWALRHTDCPYVFFLNPDTRVEPGCLSHLIQRFDEDSVGAVAPRITTMGSPPTLWYGGGYMNWWKGSASVPGYGGPVDSGLALRERDVEFASGCALLIRRDVLERCGGFDPRYFMYEEDVELSLRIITCGLRIRYVPDSIVRHACQGSLVGRDGKPVRGILNPKNPKLPFYVELIARNRWFTIWTHGSAQNKMRYLIVGTLWWVSRALSFIRYRRSDAVVALVRGWVVGLKSKNNSEVRLGRAA